MDKPYLTLVDDREHDAEFIPLPFYSWDERPAHIALEVEECETAIHLAEGHLLRAAELLKVPLFRLNRAIVRHPKLQRIYQEAATLLAHRAASEYIEALASSNDRRREWASSKILASRAAQSHPFAPAPSQPNSASLALTETPTSRTLTFRFRTDQDPDPTDAV